MSSKKFPEIIWFLWLQGLENAPLVVRKCYASWLTHNPRWQVNLLHEGNINDFVSVDITSLTKQAFSDVLRIDLLEKYGGVWVDATCYCNRPLDDWLPEYLPTGFFAFERPGPDRMISSWFIAAAPGNYIVSAYRQAVHDYWKQNPGLIFFEDSRWYFLRKRMSRLNPQKWFGYLVTKIMKVYPYFWFHYLFESIYLRDNTFRIMWDSTPKISSDIPHSLQFAGLFNAPSTATRQEIASRTAPLYKLTWKFSDDEYKNGTLLYYLLEQEI